MSDPGGIENLGYGKEFEIEKIEPKIALEELRNMSLMFEILLVTFLFTAIIFFGFWNMAVSTFVTRKEFLAEIAALKENASSRIIVR